MPNEYTARAMAILESSARFNEVDKTTGDGVYWVRVNGEMLADEDTYALRLKIENALRNAK